MAIALVQSTQSAVDTGANLTVVYSPAPTLGNVIVAVVTCRPTPTGGGVPTLALSAETWTAGPSGASDNHIIQLFYRVAGASESTDVTVTPTLAGKTSFTIAMSIWEFSGITTPELDKSNSGSSTTSVSSIATGTTGTLAVADEVVVSGGTLRLGGTGSAISDDSSLTVQAELAPFSRFRHRAGYRIVSATTAQNVTWSSTSSASAGAVIATFRAAGGGPAASSLSLPSRQSRIAHLLRR